MFYESAGSGEPPRLREATLVRASISAFVIALLSLVLVILWIVGQGQDMGHRMGRIEGRLDHQEKTIDRQANEIMLYRTYVETLHTAMATYKIEVPPLPVPQPATTTKENGQ